MKVFRNIHYNKQWRANIEKAIKPRGKIHFSQPREVKELFVVAGESTLCLLIVYVPSETKQI